MRIKGAIIDELRSLDWVPRSVRARAREVERANAKLEHLLQRAPTDEEIADELGITVDELNDSLLAISHSSIVALDELWSVSDSSGDQVSLMDTIEDPSAPDPARALDVGDLKDRIADSIAKLPEREKLVIALYYYENLTLREIGEVLGVTESRVSQLHTKAVLRLRSRMQEEAFERPERRPRDAPALAALAARRVRRYRGAPSDEEACSMAAKRGSRRTGPAQAADRIRNVALVGHRGSGKTSLHEALLFEAGVINRLGTVPEDTTVSDSEPDEQARQMSISTTLSSFEWHERKINLLDTPGEPSFVADALGALRVCESAVFVVNAVMGAEVTTSRLWARAAELDIARMLFVNMLDRERADFFRTLESLKGAFGAHVVATEIPIGSEHEIDGVIDLVDMKAFRQELRRRPRAAPGLRARSRSPTRGRARAGIPREADGRGLRSLRRADGALPRGRGDLPRGDRRGAQGGHQPRQDLPRRVRLRDAQPRHHPAARRDRRGPALAGQARRAAGGRGRAPAPTEDGELFAYVFKTRADPFAGRINLLRVYQGVLRADSQVLNTRAHVKERIGQLLVFAGKEVEHVEEFGPGDIGAVAKLKETRAGDWLAARDEPIEMPRLTLPAPVMAFAVEPKSRGDEDKVLASLRRLQEEDPTIDLHRDPQTGEQIVAGLSQVHVEVIVDRLRDRFGVEVTLKPPRVPYQETIRRPAAAHGRHKKQSGGRGQFGDCQHRDRAARDRRRRRGLRVRRPDQGRRDPRLVHPRRREGRARGDGGRRARRLPGQGRARAARRRPAPLRRLLGDRLQARRRAGDEAGARAGRPGAARADHARHAVGARGERRRRDRRPQQPPRAPAGDGADRRDDRDQGRGADGRDAHLRARPALDHRRPGRLHAGVPALRGGSRAPRPEGRRAGGARTHAARLTL